MSEKKRRVAIAAVAMSGVLVGMTGLAQAQQPPVGQEPIVTPPLELSSKPVPGTADKVGFLAGCWQATGTAGEVLTEAWFAPQTGVSMGMGHTVRNGKVIMTESMRLYEEAGTLKLWMQPAGRGPLTFALDDLREKSAVFGVKDGSSVTKITYRTVDKDTLDVAFRTQKDADRRGADFTFKRIDCAGLFAVNAGSAKK